jgi:guanosine-3',5'-bis(diphosphate) 3'-pyrophosphohydrolase
LEETKQCCSFDAGLLLRAVEFAAVKHRDQRRKGIDASPYINHPITVATMIANIGGVHNLPTLLAAILHDTIEDTCTSKDELETLFGPAVLNIVLEVTDDKNIPKLERKRLQIEHAHSLSSDAKLVKLADKCDNIRSVSENPPSDWSKERRMEYLDWAEKVVAECRGTNTALESHFDETLKGAKKKLQTL